MFLGEQASSVRQPGREGSDHGGLQGRLEGDDSEGDGETLRLQGDLGTLSINSGEHLAWKNKVIKGGLVSAYVWLLHVAVVMFWG